jgi:hypothetical protein
LKTAFEVKWKEKSVVATMDIAEAQRRVRKIKILACIIFDDEIKIRFLFLVLYKLGRWLI